MGIPGGQAEGTARVAGLYEAWPRTLPRVFEEKGSQLGRVECEQRLMESEVKGYLVMLALSITPRT